MRILANTLIVCFLSTISTQVFAQDIKDYVGTYRGFVIQQSCKNPLLACEIELTITADRTRFRAAEGDKLHETEEPTLGVPQNVTPSGEAAEYLRSIQDRNVSSALTIGANRIYWVFTRDAHFPAVTLFENDIIIGQLFTADQLKERSTFDRALDFARPHLKGLFPRIDLDGKAPGYKKPAELKPMKE
jgi:hypothetical protein